MNNKQVAHIWAQGNGETAKGSNFRCEDNILYSYSTVVGCIIDGVVFLSADNMTPSTGKQLSYAKRACGYRYFTTPYFQYSRRLEWPQLTARNLIASAAEAHAEFFKELCKKRKPDVDGYENRRQEIIATAARFNVSIPEMPEATGDLKEKARQYREQEAKREIERQEREAEKRKAQQVQDAEQLQIWLTTGQGGFPRSYSERGNDRLSIRGETVITSQGAEAPLDHVIKALRFYDGRQITDCYQWVPYQTNGHVIHLGHFKLDSIDERGNVKAGCHTLSAAEIARFRAQWSDVLGGEK